MKTTLKSIFTISIFILFVTFSSCEADKEIIEKSPSNGIIAKRYSLQSQEGKANYKLNKAVNQIIDLQTDTQINSKVVFNPIAGLLFDDEKGLYIQQDERQSYTFPIINLNPEAKVENICFNEKTDGSFDIYLVKYDFTKDEHETLTREQLDERETKFEELVIDGFDVAIENVVCIEIIAFVPSTAVAPLDQGELTGNFGSQNGNGTWVTIANNCFTENDGVGGDGGFNGGLGTGGTGTGGDNGGGTGTGDGGVITGSVIDNTEFVSGNTPVGAMIDLFKSTLEPNQLTIFNNHPEFANYLALNNCSPNSMNTISGLLNYIDANNNSSESTEFILQLIDIIIENDLVLDVNPQSEINEDINDLNELSVYVQSIQYNFYDEDPGDSNSATQNQVFGSKTIELSPIIDLTFEVVANKEPSFSLESSGCVSFISNMVVGNTWVQNSMSLTDVNYSSTHAKITLSGYNNVGISLEGLEVGIKQRRKITFLIDKETGELCCSEVTKL